MGQLFVFRLIESVSYRKDTLPGNVALLETTVNIVNKKKKYKVSENSLMSVVVNVFKMKIARYARSLKRWSNMRSGDVVYFRGEP